MRGTFIRTLVEIAERDARVVLLTGDLGFMALEPFMEKCPERFFNVGVAEQNMVGLATGLAKAGFIPFVYSIAPFAVLRPYEFIRNGPIAHRLPVRIVGVGGGFEYGTNGLTHYGIDDVAVLRTQPGITIISPADYAQTRAALNATWNLPGPVYYRLGKDDWTLVRGLEGRFELGRMQIIREGGDLLMLVMGSVAVEAVSAADSLAERGLACAVGVIASVAPPPLADLAELLSRYRAVMTVEAHYVVGGLGSLVAEVIAERGIACRLERCGVRSVPDGVTGSQNYMHRAHRLSREALLEAALHAAQLA